MRRIRIGLLLITILIFALGVISTHAENTSIFGDAITSSLEEVRKNFDMTKQDKVSVTTESGVPIIYMQAADVGHWIMSKESVELSEFTYTVNVAFAEGVGKEASIFVGADARYFNGFQVYLSKRGSNLVFVKAAELVDGNYTKVLEETVQVDKGDSSETYFKIQLRVKDADMAVYLNDEYINTVHVDKGFKGRVGVRCTGNNNVVAVSDLRIKELSLVRGTTDIRPDESTTAPGKTDAPQKTPGNFSTTTVPTKAPTHVPMEHTSGGAEITMQPTQEPSETNHSEEFPILLVGGTVLSTVICTCAIIVVAYMFVKKTGK